MISQITTSAPGRICLFGEHQDYLGMPVIAAAISKRVEISGKHRTDRKVVIHMPDIGKKEVFELAPVITYSHDRDYFKSALNVLARKGYHFPTGFEVTIHGTIPINSGTSSSSALMVAWINWLLSATGQLGNLSEEAIGELAYETEVLEFGEPGGMMDHFATAVGGVMYLESQPAINVRTFQPTLGTFVLGDSLEPKDTIGILKHVKFGMLEALRKIRQYDPAFSLHVCPIEEASAYKKLLSTAEYNLLASNLSDRDVLREALTMLETDKIDDLRLGELLSVHQENLREHKRVSTPKIDRMLKAALDAGAYGGKINGSGGGGCMFAYAPQDPELVAASINAAGGKSYIITVGAGTNFQVNKEQILQKL